MPINIYRNEASRERLAYLNPDAWLLVELIPSLETWLRQHKHTMAPGKYVADVGYVPRDAATGGGAVMSPEIMHMMADLGMSLFLSEYNSPDKNA